MTIAIAMGQREGDTSDEPRRRHRLLKRALIIGGSALIALVALVGSWVGLSLYRIDHAVHHVGVPAWLLARGKNDLLAIVKGPDHSEQAFVFHADGGHTNVLQIPEAMAVPLRSGASVPLEQLSLHAPATIIAGLEHLGIPVSHYVGVDLHMVSVPTAKDLNGKVVLASAFPSILRGFL